MRGQVGRDERGFAVVIWPQDASCTRCLVQNCNKHQDLETRTGPVIGACLMG